MQEFDRFRRRSVRSDASLCAMKEIWTGADAVVFLMDRYDGGEPINCGTGSGVSIRQLAEMIGRVAGFEGKLVFDIAKPDGTHEN
jgi:nucleoside-diphosphate-sugar epimerase